MSLGGRAGEKQGGDGWTHPREWYAILDNGDVGCLTWSRVGGQSGTSKHRSGQLGLLGESRW